MQITSQTSTPGETKQVLQALLLKRALKADGEQKQQLIESADMALSSDSDDTKKVGRYLDVKV